MFGKQARFVPLLQPVTSEQVRKIAELKMPDLNTESIESAMAMVAGAARSMGIEVRD